MDHDSTFRTIMVRPCFPVSLSSGTTAEGSAVVLSKKSLNLHLHLHKPQPLKAVHPFNSKIWGVFLLSSGFRVTSAFDGNAVGARTCGAKVPNPREVDTRHEVGNDTRINSRPAVIVLRDKGRLAIGPEEREEGIRNTSRLYRVEPGDRGCKSVDVAFVRRLDIPLDLRPIYLDFGNSRLCCVRSNGNAIGPGSCRLKMPDLHEVGTDREIAHDSSVSVLAAVVIFGDEGGLAVWTEERHEDICRSFRLDDEPARGRNCKPVEVQFSGVERLRSPWRARRP